MKSFKVLLAVAGLLAASIASAQERAPGAREHDGFFLQLDLGVGGLATGAEEDDIETTLSGGAGQFSVALGGAVTPRFLVGARAWGITVNEPTLEIDGDEFDLEDTTLSLSGLGLELMYYFMPLNLYVSLTPSVTTVNLDIDGDEQESDPGFGLRAAVGKEWWVSDRWALGLNGQVALASNDTDDLGTLGSVWAGIAFSATFD